MNSKFEPIVSYNKVALIIVCLLPFLIGCLFGVIDKTLPFYFAPFVTAPIYVVFFGLLHILLKKYFEEFVRIQKDSILYRDSKINGGMERIINITDLKNILWENENFMYVPGSRNSIYLVDNSSNKQVLVQNKITWLLSINKGVLDNLSKGIGCPIKRKHFYLSGDQKQRREQT
jgi:hypothetical protein